MSTRGVTFEQRSFVMSRPGGIVTFNMPNSEESLALGKTTIVIPTGSKWSPEPHWHEKHDEFFVVQKGSVRLVVNGQSRIVRPGDGVQRIEAYNVHDFWRADVGMQRNENELEIVDGDVIVEEWTSPADGLKEVFFRNLFSNLIQNPKPLEFKAKVQLLMVQAHGDNYPVLGPSEARIWQPFTRIVFFLALVLGSWLGLRPWYEEFTPPRLRKVAAAIDAVENAESESKRK